MQELNVKQLVQAMRSIAEEKNLPEPLVLDVVQQALAAAWRRDHGERDQMVRSEINTNTGDVTVFVAQEVVEQVENPFAQISLSDAQAINPDVKLGESVELSQPAVSFGRVAAQTAKQVVLQKLREAEREVVMSEYADKIGTVLVGTVQRAEPRLVRVELGRTSGILPASEQIPGEYYGIGNRVKVFLKDVERGLRGPQIILSRANEQFVEFLFRQEVPEMENGAVEIKAVAREAGRRTKLAVFSAVPGVDPVGTFVGGHGTRVQAVVNEIGEQEKIDIVTYSDNPSEFIKNALSPAEIAKIEIDETAKRAKVYVSEDQQSIAIGRGGQNVRLASRLTGYELDIEPLAGQDKTEVKPKSVKPRKGAADKKPRKDIEDSLLEALEEASSEQAESSDKV
ncbi:MAG: transcription termination/antitermination protein NusA [Candidatus Chaera renei]|uniref:Transcription termination/antitermination protein NusA n=1 Tax=Candidatus Chaera renei TaxID=2506947 RepID=A0A4Q0AIP7_9BACT|nr:MAG: transcription termination/antitermination protein NusA [Candidatus Chaera renei]